MTEEQYLEYVAEAMNRHISRDDTVDESDKDWENLEFAQTLAQMLRLHGLAIPPCLTRDEE